MAERITSHFFPFFLFLRIFNIFRLQINLRTCVSLLVFIGLALLIEIPKKGGLFTFCLCWTHTMFESTYIIRICWNPTLPNEKHLQLNRSMCFNAAAHVDMQQINRSIVSKIIDLIIDWCRTNRRFGSINKFDSWKIRCAYCMQYRIH